MITTFILLGEMLTIVFCIIVITIVVFAIYYGLYYLHRRMMKN